MFLLFAGAAIRHCDAERGWLEPDLCNCTSPPFVELSAAVRRPLMTVIQQLIHFLTPLKVCSKHLKSKFLLQEYFN